MAYYPGSPAAQPRKRPAWIWPVVIIGVVLFLACTGCFGLSALSAGDDDSRARTSSDTLSASVAAGEGETKAPPVNKDGKARSGGWRLDSITYKNEYGMPTATARLTNESDDSGIGVFEISLLTGDKVHATFLGSASDIQVGKSTTVKFVGENVGGWKVDGKYTTQFEKDL